MNRMRGICMASIAVFALAAALIAPAAFAELPDKHVLSGETYPAVSEGEVSGTEVVVLETEIGEKLTAGALHISEELTELSSLGPISKWWKQVLEPKTKTSCNTPGDAAGNVKISGEKHIVKPPVQVGKYLVVYLFKETTIECNSGKLKVKLRSPVIFSLEKVTSGSDTTEYGLVSKCSGKGKAESKEYLNDEEKAVKGVLTMNFGLGFESACENVSKELVMKSSKMVVFL